MMNLKKWKAKDLVMADFGKFLQTYKKYESTFKETSLDNSHKEKEKEYVCTDETQVVINFDKIMEARYPNSNDRPNTFDAIYRDKSSDKIYLVEFKNGRNKPDNKDIENKLEYGKKELNNFLNELGIQIQEYKFIFCFVYNKYEPKTQRHKRGLFKSTLFEYLNKYKNDGTVSDIYAENVNFFTKEFNKKNKKLECLEV